MCGTLVHDSSVVFLSKKCGWFYLNLHHFKQITCVVGSPIHHAFNQTEKPSYVEKDERLIHLYICFFFCSTLPFASFSSSISFSIAFFSPFFLFLS